MVRLAVSGRSGRAAVSLAEVIELPNPQWAVCTDGLRCRQRHYHIPALRLIAGTEDWPAYMSRHSWVDPALFKEAYETARELLRPARP
ncbi:hypothetical protein [Actinoplanes sp. NPDC051851]|uniref:hypothetical protein n=1 Tax=Actinoplanes sp. NPDC051851 TaxID=3154753 RepID=UPI00342DC3D0